MGYFTLFYLLWPFPASWLVKARQRNLLPACSVKFLARSHMFSGSILIQHATRSLAWIQNFFSLTVNNVSEFGVVTTVRRAPQENSILMTAIHARHKNSCTPDGSINTRQENIRLSGLVEFLVVNSLLFVNLVNLTKFGQNLLNFKTIHSEISEMQRNYKPCRIWLA